MSSFDKPIGSVADVRELEYISGLHQTDPAGVRVDGSIKGMFCIQKTSGMISFTSSALVDF